MSDTNNELWQNFVPEEQHFKIKDFEVTIPANMDLYNDYKNYFYNLSIKLKAEAEKDYNSQITDYASFIEKAFNIYRKYLDIVADKAMDIFISNGLYNLTKEDFIKTHFDLYHKTYDYYSDYVNKAKEKAEQKANMASSLWNFMEPQKGAVIATKDKFNSAVRSAKMENALNSFLGNIAVKRATKLTKGEQNNLYKEINGFMYLTMMKMDFYSSYNIVVELLSTKVDIWKPNREKSVNANKILKNISNPNFPKEQKMTAFADIFLSDPYNTGCIKFLENEYGSSEVKELKEYLGYVVNQKKICPKCGAEAASGTRFCADCGTPLE